MIDVAPRSVLSLELVAVPVSDVDRAKAFYVDRLGFRADHDHQVDEDHRFVRLTPPGSACSIALTAGYVDSDPGSLKDLQVVVDPSRTRRAGTRLTATAPLRRANFRDATHSTNP